MLKLTAIASIFACTIALSASQAALADTRIFEFTATVPEQASIEPLSPDTPGFSAANPAPAQLDTSSRNLTKIVAEPVIFTVNNNAPATVTVSAPVAIEGTLDPIAAIRQSLLTVNGNTAANAIANLPAGSNILGVSISIDSSAPIQPGIYKYQVTVTVSPDG